MIFHHGLKGGFKPAPSGIFLPTDISSNCLWLDAGDAANRTIATGFTQTKDKSGKGYHFNQSGSTTIQPALATVGGYECMQFDGSNDYMENANMVENVYEIWAVLRYNSFGAGQPLHVYQMANTAGGLASQFTSRNDGSSIPRRTPRWNANDGTTSTTITGTNTGYAISTIQLVRLQPNSTTWVDGVDISSTSPTGNYAAIDNSGGVNSGKLGATRTLSAYGKVNLYQLLMFNAALSAGDVTNMETFLNTAYGL